jgi:hypothetical protein
MLLAKSNGGGPNFEAPASQPVGLSTQPQQDVLNLLVQLYTCIPQSLTQHACLEEHLLVERVFGTQLVPHTGLTSDDVGVRDHRIISVHFSPGLERPISISIEIVKPDIKIHLVIVRQYDLILPARQRSLIRTSPPPMDNIIILNRQIDFFVCPIYRLLGLRYLLPEHLLLALTIIYR